MEGPWGANPSPRFQMGFMSCRDRIYAFGGANVLDGSYFVPGSYSLGGSFHVKVKGVDVLHIIYVW